MCVVFIMASLFVSCVSLSLESSGSVRFTDGSCEASVT